MTWLLVKVVAENGCGQQFLMHMQDADSHAGHTFNNPDKDSGLAIFWLRNAIRSKCEL